MEGRRAKIKSIMKKTKNGIEKGSYISKSPKLLGISRNEIGAGLLILGYGFLFDRFIPEKAYVPANMAAAAAAVFIARKAGVSLSEMGLAKEKIVKGVKVGAKTLVPIATAVIIGVVLPFSRKFFLDTDVINASGGRIIYEVFLRIPLGTALSEELIFRGALLGLYMKNHSKWKAIVLSSAVFGLWHIFPTLQSLSTNPAAEGIASSSVWSKAGVLGAVTAVTAIAGAGFCWLKVKSESLLAPWMAHTALNSVSILGGKAASIMKCS